jgi:hypothetical protein
MRITELLKSLQPFIILDILTILAVLGTLISRERSLRLDEQSRFFFLSLLAIYVLIPGSIMVLIKYSIKNFKSFTRISLALFLNIHAIIVSFWFIRQMIIIYLDK